MNAYEILGARPGMDPEQLGRCFRKRLRAVHPDLNPSLAAAAERTREVIEAYELLSDPKRRAALDSILRSQAESARRATREEADETEQPRTSSRQTAAGKRRSKQKRTSRKRATGKGSGSTRTVVEINGQRVEFSGDVHVAMAFDGATVVAHSSATGSSVSTVSEAFSVGGAPLGERRVHGGPVEGVVLGDLHVTGGDVRLLGQVLGNVYVAPGASLHVLGQVIGDLHLDGSTLVVMGMVVGNIHTGGGSVEVVGQHLGTVFDGSR